MPTICTSISLPYDVWDDSRKYRLNRSQIAKQAISNEIARIKSEAIPTGMNSHD